MTSDVTITGLDEFRAKLAKLDRAVASEKSLTALEAGAYTIMGFAQDNIRRNLNKHPTGNLVNSVGVKRKAREVLVGVWGVVYAAIHEFGGVIEARHGPYLVFQVDGHWVKTKKVHIPARPYLRPAVDEHIPEINRSISDTMRVLIEVAVK